LRDVDITFAFSLTSDASLAISFLAAARSYRCVTIKAKQLLVDLSANSPTREEKTLDYPSCFLTEENFLVCRWHPWGPDAQDCPSFQELQELE
jgi:hypothetical protein